eukprot:3276184-Rhodomonas_salina.4
MFSRSIWGLLLLHLISGCTWHCHHSPSAVRPSVYLRHRPSPPARPPLSHTKKTSPDTGDVTLSRAGDVTESERGEVGAAHLWTPLPVRLPLRKKPVQEAPLAK